LDEDYNLLAYSLVSPSYSKSELPFTLCNLNYRDKIDRIRDFALNFEKKVPTLDSDAVTFEKDSQNGLCHLKIDESKLPNSIRLEDIKYYITTYERENRTIGSLWCDYQYSVFRDGNFIAIDKGKEERFIDSDGLVIFLYDENKEILGYVYAEDGIGIN